MNHEHGLDGCQVCNALQALGCAPVDNAPAQVKASDRYERHIATCRDANCWECADMWNDVCNDIEQRRAIITACLDECRKDVQIARREFWANLDSPNKDYFQLALLEARQELDEVRAQLDQFNKEYTA